MQHFRFKQSRRVHIWLNNWTGCVMFEDVFLIISSAKNPFCFVFIFSKQLPLNYFGGLHFPNPSVPSPRRPPKKSPGVDCLDTRMKSTGVVVEKIELNPSKRLIWTGHRFDLKKVYDWQPTGQLPKPSWSCRDIKRCLEHSRTAFRFLSKWNLL